MFWKKKNKCMCGQNIEEKWNYCPQCGIPLKQEALRMGAMKVPHIKMGSSDFGISFSITSSGIGLPKIEVRRIGQPAQHNMNVEAYEEKEPKPALEGIKRGVVKNTIEPEMLIEKRGQETIYIIKLPKGISLNDIHIKRLSSSVEIRAYYKDTLYFKIFELPSGRYIENKTLKDGLLELTVR